MVRVICFLVLLLTSRAYTQDTGMMIGMAVGMAGNEELNIAYNAGWGVYSGVCAVACYNGASSCGFGTSIDSGSCTGYALSAAMAANSVIQGAENLEKTGNTIAYLDQDSYPWYDTQDTTWDQQHCQPNCGVSDFPPLPDSRPPNSPGIPTGNGNYIPYSAIDNYVAKAEELKQQMKKKFGITVNPDGSYNVPGKGRIPAGAFSSAGAMQAAGFSSSEIKAMQSFLKDGVKQHQKFQKKFKSASIDGSDFTNKYKSGLLSGNSSFFADSSASTRLRGDKKNAVAAMNKNLGDSKIGVAADNIWHMIRRRYTDERKNLNLP